MLAVHVPLSAFYFKAYVRRSLTEVTDVFHTMDGAPAATNGGLRRHVRARSYLATQTAVNAFLTPEGKLQAAEFFREAMTNNLHHF